METQGVESFAQAGPLEGEAPGLAGIVGRMRLLVRDQPVGVLEVNNGRAKLVPDGGAVDVTATCISRDVVIKLLRGTINPIVMALQSEGRLQGDRERGVKILYGLRAGSPFTETSFDGKDS
ncbi:MAG TPA: hypothetical protein VN853_03285 [Polyangia bacterium]|jgi:hypothetical protein|nr:hypothetical protein [Polyangia bacterium]